MAEKSALVWLQTWNFKVTYLTQDNQQVGMTGAFCAQNMDIVYRYLQRKFGRFASKIEHIDVTNGGYRNQGTMFELTQYDDGSIKATNAQGVLVASEPQSVAEACGVALGILTPPGAKGVIKYGAGYTPPPKKEVFPSLIAYDNAFSKWYKPLDLSNRDKSTDNQFKAKFYEIFPKG